MMRSEGGRETTGDDRFAHLLEETLRTGAIPAGVSAAERDELADAVRSVRTISAASGAAEAEARASMPTARARFQRHMAAQTRPVPARPTVQPKRARHGFFASLFTVRRSAVGLAAVLAVVAAAALFGSQLTGNEDTASAQVLTPGDYVQLEGVVSATTDGGVTLATAFGDLGVDVSPATSVLANASTIDASALKAGDAVLVSGVVSAGQGSTAHRVTASTVAVSPARATPPRQLTIKQLRDAHPDLSGKVVTFTLGPNGNGRVLIETADGRRLLVPVNATSAARLLSLSVVLGATVEVQERQDDAYSLDIPTPPGGSNPTGPARPTAGAQPEAPAPGAPVHIQGVALGRAGLLLEVQTRRGPAIVRIARHTRVLLADSGLLPGEFDRGERISGHTVAVTGGIDKATGQVIADLIVVGPLAPAR